MTFAGENLGRSIYDSVCVTARVFKRYYFSNRRLAGRSADEGSAALFLKIADEILLPVITVYDYLLFHILVKFQISEKFALETEYVCAVFVLGQLYSELAVVETYIASALPFPLLDRYELSEFNPLLKLMDTVYRAGIPQNR